jgi:hypothetical protein
MQLCILEIAVKSSDVKRRLSERRSSSRFQQFFLSLKKLALWLYSNSISATRNAGIACSNHACGIFISLFFGHRMKIKDRTMRGCLSS